MPKFHSAPAWLVALTVSCAGFANAQVQTPPVSLPLGAVDGTKQEAIQFQSLIVPEAVKTVTRQGQSLWVATEKNEILRLDPDSGKSESFGIQTNNVLSLAVNPNRVFMATENNGYAIQVLDIPTRRILYTIPTKWGIRQLHVVNDDLVIGINGGDVYFFQPSTGKNLAKIDVPGGVLMQSHLTDGKLYIAREYAGGLVVIDVAHMSLLEIIPVKDWLFQVRVIGDRALVWGSMMGLGFVDLKTKKYQNLSRVSNPQLRVGPQNTFFVAEEGHLRQLDASGNVVNTITLDKSISWHLADTDGSAPLLFNKNELLVGKVDILDPT